MELKLRYMSDRHNLTPGLNRTFMELKPFAFDKTNGEKNVLIAPLWN